MTDNEPTLAQVGEFGVIDQIVAGRRQPDAVTLGPGDDAAVITAADGRVVVSTDPHRPTGSVLRVDELRARLADAASEPVDLGDGRSLVACGGTSLGLVLG